MAEHQAAIGDILQQVLSEYAARMKMDGSSKILVSDASIAKAIFEETKGVRTPYGPQITIAKRGVAGEDASAVEGVATYKAVEQLEMDHYSHSIFGVSVEDPKFILQGMRSMLNAMQPKGIAVVIAPKIESGKTGDDGQLTVSLEDKMKYQSKGKIEKLSDVMEYAGFEKGKIRTFEKTSEAGGKKVEADVVLAIKWDQLTG